MTWREQAASIRAELETEHAAREMALSEARRIIQAASRAIRHIHRGETANAERVISEAKEGARKVREALAASPRILYAGYVHDAEKEFVEAVYLLAMIEGKPWPTHEVLGVSHVTLLHGAAEAASELRRTMLDRMRDGDFVSAARCLAMMEEVYDELISMDFPDGMTNGLRRTTDALRAVLERSRSDLTLTEVQERLRRTLETKN